MNALADPKLVPPVALLAELDNLLAQLRSMEDDLKRAQTAADARIAALKDQIAQLERVRDTNEEEIVSLRNRAAIQERAWSERQEAVTGVELALHSKIQSLREDLARSRRDLEERVAAIEDARAQAEAERQDLASRFRRGDAEHRAAQAAASETQKRLDAKIHELELQLAEKQLRIESGAVESVNLRSQLARLTRQDPEAGSDGIEANAVVERPAQSEKTDATAFDKQEMAMKIDGMNKSPAQTLQEGEKGGASPLEHSLREEIDRLMREAHERNQILQDRNEELVRVKSELDRLLERDNEIESASSRAERAYSSEAERMRNEFQAQLALLQAELSQKQWALEEYQAETRGREQDLRQEIDSLRRQLADSAAQKEHHAPDFVFGEPRSGLAREPRFESAGAAGAADDGKSGFVGQRRWNSGFGWKRRWRT